MRSWNSITRCCLLLLLVAIVLCADVALGCPTCKDQLANDPAAQNLVRGYFYSILFMISRKSVVEGQSVQDV